MGWGPSAADRAPPLAALLCPRAARGRRLFGRPRPGAGTCPGSALPFPPPRSALCLRGAGEGEVRPPAASRRGPEAVSGGRRRGTPLSALGFPPGSLCGGLVRRRGYEVSAACGQGAPRCLHQNKRRSEGRGFFFFFFPPQYFSRSDSVEYPSVSWSCVRFFAKLEVQLHEMPMARGPLLGSVARPPPLGARTKSVFDKCASEKSAFLLTV